MQFSKKVAVFVCIIFAFVILYSAYTFFFLQRVSVDLLTAAGTPFAVIISGYFAKAGVENYTKIKGTDTTGQ